MANIFLSVLTAVVGFAAHYHVAGTVLPMIFVLAGSLFLTLEFFFIPGFGVIGLSGFLTLGYGIYLRPEAALLLISVATSFILSFIMALQIPKSKIFQSLTLTAVSPVVGDTGTNKAFESLVGRTGEAVTDLGPAGKIEIDEKTLTALSKGEFIPKGSSVRVVSIDCNSVVVEIVK